MKKELCKNFIKKNMLKIIITIDIIIVLIILGCWVSWDTNNIIPNIKGICFSSNDNYMRDFYLSQISLSFITISIMSILSDKENTLYWENLSDKNLIRPLFLNMFSCVWYSFSTIIVSTVGLIIDNKHVVFFSFLFNIFFLTVLSCKMLNLYFNRDKQKKEMEKQFKKSDDEILAKLKANTLLAIANNNPAFVIENIDFYVEYCEYKDAEYILDYVESKNVYYAEIILNKFSEKTIKKVDEQNSNEIKHIFEKWNPICYLPNNIIKNIVDCKAERSWEHLFEDILIVSRNILVACYEKIFDVKIKSREISYTEYRQVIRESINKLKYENSNYSAKDMFDDLKSKKDEENNKLGIALNDTKLSKLIESKGLENQLFHDAIRYSPIRDVLILMEEIVDSNELIDRKKCYYLTVFISVFTQFPIFGYLYCLNVEYSNNVIYLEIINKLNYLTDKGIEILNNDWKGLYEYIMKNKCVD